MGVLAEDLPKGPAGRRIWRSIDVELIRGGLTSVGEATLLAGANGALIETEQGWELMQFQSAELVSERRYRLGGFLRGQQGSEGAAEAGATAGALCCFLTGEDVRFELLSHEDDVDLAWRANFEGDVDGSQASSGWTSVRRRALAPWRPATGIRGRGPSNSR